MEMLPSLLAIFVRENHRSLAAPLTKSGDTGFEVFWWKNIWINRLGASDLRRHDAHGDVLYLCVAS